MDGPHLHPGQDCPSQRPQKPSLGAELSSLLSPSPAPQEQVLPLSPPATAMGWLSPRRDTLCFPCIWGVPQTRRCGVTPHLQHLPLSPAPRGSQCPQTLTAAGPSGTALFPPDPGASQPISSQEVPFPWGRTRFPACCHRDPHAPRSWESNSSPGQEGSHLSHATTPSLHGHPSPRGTAGLEMVAPIPSCPQVPIAPRAHAGAPREKPPHWCDYK